MSTDVGPGQVKQAHVRVVHAETKIKKQPRKKERKQTFKSAMRKVLKKVHPSLEISKKAMDVMNDLVMDAMGKLAETAAEVMKKTPRKTMDSRAIQTAVKLLFTGGLRMHSVQQGLTATVRYTMHSSH